MNNQTHGGNGFIGQTVRGHGMAGMQMEHYAGAGRQESLGNMVAATPGLSSEIAVAGASVGGLHEAIERLERALSGVLVPAPPRPDQINSPETQMCDAANHVRGIRNGVDLAAERLTSLIDRLGL